MKNSISSQHSRKGCHTTDSQAKILPPGYNCLTRRSALKAVLASASAAAFTNIARSETTKRKPDPRKGSPKRYAMKKSINQWAFPYPQLMNLRECLQLAKDADFEGIELNYDLENDLSPKLRTKDYHGIRRLADKIGIEISGLGSFLFWPYPLTSNDPDKRTKDLDPAGKITHAAHDLGVKNVLLVPGAVDIPWREDYEPMPNEVCDRRAREAVRKLVPQAEKLKVYLNVENIFFSGYLMTPMEMNDFVDSFQSEHVKIHFDTGNISIFQHPEHWVPVMGKRIKNTHFKEFSKKSTDHSLETFRPLLDGTTNIQSESARLRH